MSLLFSVCSNALAGGVFLLPILLVLNRFRFHESRRMLWYFLLTVYLAAMWSVVGMPSAAYIRFHWSANLIPFAGMGEDLKNGVLNVVLFVPLGCFLPLLWEAYRSLKKTVAVGFLTSAAIEILQIFTFRATDVNDLITNTLGTVLGFLLVRKLRGIPGGSSRDVGILYGCVFGVMFFLQPFLASFLWNLTN